MLGYDSLMNYFKTNFSLMQHHKYSLHEIENMIPWEKFIYIDMLKQYIKQQEDIARDQAAQKKIQASMRKK
jgi:3-methyladenine DNA glycosylase AlkD